MSNGFEGKPRVKVNKQELNNIISRYKKIKKYMRSPIYDIRNMDGTETYVSNLIKEANEDPPVD